MINYRILSRVLSILLFLEGIMMLSSALVGLLYGEKSVSPFLFSAVITIVVGIATFTPVREDKKQSGYREGYIIVAGLWLVYPLFGTLPWLLSDISPGFVNAFFESMAGFTGTGSSVFDNPATLPKAFLFWRSLTQWTGGMAIIFLSLYVLPLFRDLNIQLTTTDFSGQPGEKIHPRAVDAAKRMIGIYVILTAFEAILLVSGGLGFFDSVCISMSTLSTGGFSTHSNSLTFLTSPFLKGVITVFMFLSATNMTVVYFALKRNFYKIRENSEFIFYAVIAVGFSILIGAFLIYTGNTPPLEAIGNSIFHVVSIVSTTGFYTTDYTLWGHFAVLMLFILMFAGGTSGSASGGMKTGRLLIMAKNNRMELRRLIHPSAFIPVRLHKKILPQNIVSNVLVYVTLYFLTVIASSFIISLMGYDIVTSLGTASSMLANIGPGLGELGPYKSFSVMPDSGKMFFSGLMYLGRLELMGVLILFSRSFYRK